MPLYEFSCDSCLALFEALIPSAGSTEKFQACPECGQQAHRILSAPYIATTGKEAAPPPNGPRDDRPEVTSLKLPAAARFCAMDDGAAARVAAYRAGRGAEYDDTVAARKELASKRAKE